METVALVPDDLAGVEEFFRRHADAVLRLCRRITRNDADAEDARQEAFLALQRHHPRLDPDSNPLGWLFRTAANAALKLRTRRGPLPPPAAPEEPRLLDAEEDLARLRDSIERLPEPYRTVVIERFRHGREPAEIARALGMPAGRVRVHLFRALEMLRHRTRVP